MGLIMPRKVFVSYSHRQGEWVRNRLVPCLDAGGAEILIDHARFEAGKGLVEQMDATQDAADMSVLVLSPDYLASNNCVREMKRAIRRDPDRDGRVVAVLRRSCAVPAALKKRLYVDLRNQRHDEQWALLLNACGAELGVAVPVWLEAFVEIRRLVARGQSVNLLVHGDSVKWRPLIDHLAEAFPDLARVDLHNPATASRRGLVEEILRASGVVRKVPAEPEDLVELGRFLAERKVTRIALLHFDPAAGRGSYGFDLFAALRYHLMESRRLVLVVHSRRAFAGLLPRDHPMSGFYMQTVELRSRA